MNKSKQMSGTGRKLISVVLALTFIFSMVPIFTVGIEADVVTVTYVKDAKGNDRTNIANSATYYSRNASSGKAVTILTDGERGQDNSANSVILNETHSTKNGSKKPNCQLTPGGHVTGSSTTGLAKEAANQDINGKKYYYYIDVALSAPATVDGFSFYLKGYKACVMDHAFDVYYSTNYGESWTLIPGASTEDPFLTDAEEASPTAPIHYTGWDKDAGSGDNATSRPTACIFYNIATPLENVTNVAYACAKTRCKDGHYTSFFSEMEVYTSDDYSPCEHNNIVDGICVDCGKILYQTAFASGGFTDTAKAKMAAMENGNNIFALGTFSGSAGNFANSGDCQFNFQRNEDKWGRAIKDTGWSIDGMANIGDGIIDTATTGTAPAGCLIFSKKNNAAKKVNANAEAGKEDSKYYTLCGWEFAANFKVKGFKIYFAQDAYADDFDILVGHLVGGTIVWEVAFEGNDMQSKFTQVSGTTNTSLYSYEATFDKTMEGRFIQIATKSFDGHSTENRTDYYSYVCPEFEVYYGEVIFKSASLDLGESLNMNFFANVSNAAKTTVNFKIGDDYDVTVAGTQVNGNEYVFRFENIAPQYMGDEITATYLVDGEKVTDMTYSIAEYCQDVLKKNPGNTKLETLVNDLLVYGGEAQAYTNHGGERVDKGITGSTFSKPSSTFGPTASSQAEHCQIVGAGVRFEGFNKIYFEVEIPNADDVAKVELKIGGKTAELVGNNIYRAYTSGIKASSLFASFEATLYYNSNSVQTISYSVKDYVAAMADDAKVGGLVKALYNYGLSANNYVA